MPDGKFNIEAVDHIELYVFNKTEAARWYKWVFDLDQEFPAETHHDAGEPVLIRIGEVTLALYKGDMPTDDAPCVGIRRVALRTDGEGFLAMLAHLEDLEIPLTDDSGNHLKPKSAVDHGDSYAVYFADFYCNSFEVVTYEYDYVKERIPKVVI